LLLKNRLPIGIITDKDLRSKIATGMLLSTLYGPNYVSTGNYCPTNRSVAEVQLLMMQHNIGHLCDFRWCATSKLWNYEHDVLPLRLITLSACETNNANTAVELQGLERICS
jgi:CBS domain-containing protein